MITGFDPLLGLDSLIAAFLLSPWIPSPALRLRLAAWFGLADGIATVAGALLSHGLPEWVGVTAVVAILASAIIERSPLRLAYLLAIGLSLDNLVSADPAIMAPALGVTSALMAWIGFVLGANSDHLLRRIRIHS